jgi:hypothetical protein
MPLSEYEDRMLAQIEGALCAEDPKFASRLRRAKPRESTIGRRIRGVTLVTVGVAALISGLALPATMIGGFPILSVAGYLLMWGGAVELLTGPVIRGAIAMASRVARWAREESGRK